MRFADAATAQKAVTWLSDLSDGYVNFGDFYAKLPGAVVVQAIQPEVDLPEPVMTETAVSLTKPFFIGHSQVSYGAALPAFSWTEPADAPMKRTTLYDAHVALGGRIVPFWRLRDARALRNVGRRRAHGRAPGRRSVRRHPHGRV